MARRDRSAAAASDPALTQKKRARRRLVGAVVLGLAAVIVLPLVLDSEPRQAIDDIEISIPSLDQALPPIDRPRSGEIAVAPAAPVTSPAPATEAPVPPVSAKPAGAVTSAAGDVQVDVQGLTQSTGNAAADTPDFAPPDRASSADPTAAGLPAERVRQAGKRPARSLTAAAGTGASADGTTSRGSAPAGSSPTGSSPTGSSPAAAVPMAPAREAAPAAPMSATAGATSQPPANGAAGASSTPSVAAADRYALQIGAYANAGSARAQLDKARRTGLRAWSESIDTAQGKRTRVRVGPFATREQAEQARASLSLAGLESVVVDHP